jgi:hypothetical protein
VLQLLVDPHHPDTLYRVDAEDLSRTSVAVSRDGGASFTQDAPVSGPQTFDKVYVHPERDELLAFDPEGLKVSADGGKSWSLRGSYRGAGFRNGRLAPSDPDTLYGLTADSNHCLARSDDAGAHWQPVTSPPRLPTRQTYCTDVAIDPRDTRHVWLAVQDSRGNVRKNLLVESRDGGTSWSRSFPAPTDGAVAARRSIPAASGGKGSTSAGTAGGPGSGRIPGSSPATCATVWSRSVSRAAAWAGGSWC